jgi:Flagellar hook-length control protein FliK
VHEICAIIFGMINLTSDTRLSIILPNTNKALAEAIKTATPEQLNQLKEGKDIKSLLTSVFQDKITSSKSDQTLLDILKNTAAFKNMGNFTEDLKSLLTELKASPALAQKSDVLEGFFKNITSMDTASLKSQLENSGVFMESKIAAAIQIIPTLKETLTSLQNLLSKSVLPEAKALSAKIGSLLETPALNQPPLDLKSAEKLTDTVKHITDTFRGIVSISDVLYSKESAQLVTKLGEFTHPEGLLLDNVLRESMSNDLKSGLMKLSEELQSSPDPTTAPLLEHVDKLLTQIDYQQILSHLNNANSIYIPFTWDQLDEGSMTLKKGKDKKFYCEINLRLKEYGELDLMMGLYEGNQIEIQAHTEKPQLKALIQENIAELRSLLINSGLTPRAIRVYETKASPKSVSDSYGAQTFGSDFGFEVKA